MKNLGGTYLNPLTFFNDQYKKGDFRRTDFGERKKKSWGKIVYKFPHKSISKVLRNGNQQNLESTSDIFIATDGLIATEVPGCVTTDEEALIVLSCHLSSFLSLLNLGGIYFSPVSEKHLAHINFENNTLSQVSGGGDNYSVVSMERALHRFRIPYRPRNLIIDFNWVGMRILNSRGITTCYDLGKNIFDRLEFNNAEIILSLEAYKNYTMHKWNNTLLLGWAFIEILIDISYAEG